MYSKDLQYAYLPLIQPSHAPLVHHARYLLAISSGTKSCSCTSSELWSFSSPFPQTPIQTGAQRKHSPYPRNATLTSEQFHCFQLIGVQNLKGKRLWHCVMSYNMTRIMVNSLDTSCNIQHSSSCPLPMQQVLFSSQIILCKQCPMASAMIYSIEQKILLQHIHLHVQCIHIHVQVDVQKYV